MTHWFRLRVKVAVLINAVAVLNTSGERVVSIWLLVPIVIVFGFDSMGSWVVIV